MTHRYVGSVTQNTGRTPSTRSLKVPPPIPVTAASTSMPNGSIRERQAKMTPDRANTITPAKSNQ